MPVGFVIIYGIAFIAVDRDDGFPFPFAHVQSDLRCGDRWSRVSSSVSRTFVAGITFADANICRSWGQALGDGLAGREAREGV